MGEATKIDFPAWDDKEDAILAQSSKTEWSATPVRAASFPGPDRSIDMEALRAGRAIARRYRNRRIGEFLKELDLTEGRSTGNPKILPDLAKKF
jgi:hypothetical protein